MDAIYPEAAEELGAILAAAGISVVYGAGGTGLMGALADSALEAGGEVIGIIPQFMVDLEWAHQGISRLQVVENMHERKRLLLEGSDAVIALPGGSGTLEELLEVITLKRLGLYLNPIVIMNINDYYRPLLEMLRRSVSENFMDREHLNMWSVVEHPRNVLSSIESAPEWSADARNFAAL